MVTEYSAEFKESMLQKFFFNPVSKMKKYPIISIKKVVVCCIFASFIIWIAFVYNDYYTSPDLKIADSTIIYKNKSGVSTKVVSLSEPVAKNMKEFTIITDFHYDYRPKNNYYSTIIDSYYGKFRLMMHEHSSMRAYCNSGILWSKTVDNYQVKKVLPSKDYHVVFTYKNGKATSYIDGNLNWTKNVADQGIDLSKFSLLMNFPTNRKLRFGNTFIGKVNSITILKNALTPNEVSDLFMNDLQADNFVATDLVMNYILPWTLVFFICWYLSKISNFFVRCLSERKLIDLYVLFVYAVTICFCIVYNFGNAVIKEIESSSSGQFVSFYTFWLLYFCFFSLYLSLLFKVFKRPLLPTLYSLYFITALLVYSLWLNTTNELMPLMGNLFVAICIASFMLNPLLFQED